LSATAGSAISWSERMRITSAGNVGIGTSSPHSVSGYKFLTLDDSLGSGLIARVSGTNGMFFYSNVNGSLFSEQRALPLFFETAGSERMRITSGGNVAFGTTTATGKLTVSTTGNHIHINNSARASTDFWNLDVASTNRFYVVNQAGTGVYINNGGTSWVGSSDLRLKNIHSQITGGLSSISQLNPVKYSWKNDEKNTQYIGLIAQEVEAVIPDVVSEDDNGYKGIVYTELIPVLISAIQELKAEIETLKSQING